MSDLNPELYTVAWLAPLEIEAQAASHMLDNRHRGRFPIRRGDDYVFQAGDMCGHNVIIATLPAGQEYGTGSAAALASQVKKFLPNLWFGLLVGVAAGLPNFSRSPPLDIRLGDVLVSLPTSENTGLIAYDLGKETGQKGFQPLRSGNVLANTETIVRSAIGSIKLLAPNDAEVIFPYYENIKHKSHPNGTFVDPGQEQDILYQVDDDGNEHLVEREERPGDKRIRVWYGTIGSGDKLMKDARKRNELRDKYNLIGLEMEAAGTMNRIPVGVIRGVCDYGDKHKNKEWQPYAAAMAAAYARAVLSEVPAGTIPNKPVAPQNGRYEWQTDPDNPWKEFLEDLGESDPDTDMSRIKDDKGGWLENCFDWILKDAQLKDWQDNKDTRLLWIKGDPGKGKTMLMIGLVNELTDRLRLHESCTLSFFFCQNTEPHLNNGVSVLRGLIWKLLSENPALGCYIPKEYRLKPKDKRKAMFEESNPNIFSTLKTMLSAILRDTSFEAVYLLVDALDECDRGLDRLVEWIADNAADPQSKAKWLVSSRSTTKLDRTLKQKSHQRKITLELNHKHISRAVTRFIKQRVDNLASEGRYSEELRSKVQTTLEEKAESTFLWAALVCKHLKGVPRLEIMMELNKFPPGLPSVYERMMRLIENQGDNTSGLCKRVLCVIIIAYRPLTLEELVSMAELHKYPVADIRELVNLCGSYLILRDETIRFLHQSAKDYLGQVAEVFPSGREHEHGRIVERSLQAMSKILKKDVYGLRHPGFPVQKVNPPNPDPLSPIRYSCSYWINHLLETSKKFRDHDARHAMEPFFNKHLLHWLEALSLTRGIPNVAVMMSKFVDMILWAIENNPLQVYASALVFSPARSPVKNLFGEEELEWIRTKPAMQDDWSPCLQTLEGHSPITSVAFSHDDKYLASASIIVKIWDTATSGYLQTLKGHSNFVNSVAFSHDDKHLASASDDKTVKIWDTATGSCLQTLKDHSGSVSSVAFSHDDKHLASASHDNTVKIWDTATGSCLQTLKDHSSLVSSVAFSHDDKHLASASDIVKIWDTASGSCLQTLNGHSDWITSVAFSHDGKHLASASDTVKIWDTATDSCLQTPKDHSAWVTSVAFSHDDKHLASASDDKTVKIWDTATGSCLQTLKGHRNWVRLVAFSHDDKHLASASLDNTVKIWDAVTGSCLQTLRGHSGWINSVAFSHDDKHLASASDTVKIWDTATDSCLQTLKDHNSLVTSVAFSHDDKHLASASYDGTVKIWDRVTVAFSHDDKHLALASSDNTVKIWDTASGGCLQALDIGKALENLSFDTAGQYLRTEIGAILLDVSLASGTAPSRTAHQKPRYQGIGISSDGKWITRNSENLLWLPSEYRPSRSTVTASTVAIGCASGRVLIFDFMMHNS
ncbi:hypothetical protein FGG08_005149 [Glutinoglossum americanum]|uniref:NACHT domain-containing protein n=1 Tax=Glutinoglossum americanum TaxID=1670608 RepID=A0A9P8KWB0_9PEZI|nr:hypothetical protein FGG08_005149 [Glutinoglossum americanum]